MAFLVIDCSEPIKCSFAVSTVVHLIDLTLFEIYSCDYQ